MRFVQHFRRLSRRDARRFYEWVHSPLHCRHEDVRTIVAHLTELYPELDDAAEDRAALLRVLGRDDDAHLAVVLTYALRQLEDFHAWQTQQQADFRRQLDRLQRLRNESDLRAARKHHQRMLRDLDRQPLRNADHFRRQYELATEADVLALLSGTDADQTLARKQQLLDAYYLIEKLRNACETVVRRTILRLEHHDPLLAPLLHWLDLHPEWSTSVPALRVYVLMLRLLRDGRSEDYAPVRDALRTHDTLFPFEERQQLYNYLQNFCIAQINRGHPEFHRRLFDLYRRQLAGDLLSNDNHQFEWHYKNIVNVALRVGETDWVAAFLEDYRDLLPKQSRENAYSFNKAAYHYARHNFDRVLELLQHVEYNDLRYHLGARVLLLRTYYELGEDEVLLALTSSFRQFLQRAISLNRERSTALKNLVRFTRRTVQLRQQSPFLRKDKLDREREKLRQEMLAEPRTINRGWLLEKIALVGI